MTKNLNWGIIGLGNIAHSFATYFDQPFGDIYAAGSRDLEKAQTFANEFNIPHAYGSYEDLLADKKIDIVYIATPHNYHIETILAALNAGKHVLSEKAITMTSAELKQATDLAEEKGLILQEAMTVYHMPLYQRIIEIAEENKLGKLKMVQASFGSFKEPDPTNRFFNPNLAGGALLDIGVYALSFVRQFMTATPEITGSAMNLFESGVDESETISLRNANDEMANVSLTFRAKMPKMGIVAYEGGYFTIYDYPRANKATLVFADGSVKEIIAGHSKQAMNYEIKDVQDMVSGELDPKPFLEKTVDVMSIMTQAREQWNYKYPFEK
ncbi:Gfo/Idh/MocA family oxidoreductase [Dellaglioa algida]|uniref:Gfo/Idh/MocA family protein n=1 Tax=Dellaglioa algida TaxID=105612 RepID=UPI0024C4CB8B|nr:Gfo/Idh/MocA family oxidoreductase [Dellaglioa algida]MDK1724811.1 Gfo/Idh/MocA family oxidoreductase [Dellaglioa algida]MDK1738649.1 Gfo/Idh/MocA family oxidoreductase [Dellaglioa algida]